MQTNSTITVQELTKTYRTGEIAVHALRSCNLTIESGRMTAIVGASGSGKSTLLNLLGGMDAPDGGALFYGETDLCKLDDQQWSRFRAEQIGFVFQFFNLIPELTAKENIILPAMISGNHTYQPYLEELCDILNITDRLGHYPSELSGGQQQRVAIARALINRPKILLCDEPTGNLDASTSQEVMKLLLELNQKYNLTVVIVTHDMEIANQCDRIIRMCDGRATDSANC